MAAPSGSAIRALGLEYKSLNEDPVEGFRVKLVNDEDMFLWEVALFGPPDTLYQGGYFKVRIVASCTSAQYSAERRSHNQSFDLKPTAWKCSSSAARRDTPAQRARHSDRPPPL